MNIIEAKGVFRENSLSMPLDLTLLPRSAFRLPPSAFRLPPSAFHDDADDAEEYLFDQLPSCWIFESIGIGAKIHTNSVAIHFKKPPGGRFRQPSSITIFPKNPKSKKKSYKTRCQRCQIFPKPPGGRFRQQSSKEIFSKN